MISWKFLYKVWFLLLILAESSRGDTPCLPRKYNHNSIVCVCNSNYCDEISKIQTLPAGEYVLYTSSMSGQRFAKTCGFLRSPTLRQGFSFIGWMNQATIEIDRTKKYQKILGFGGAFTDATGINVFNLSQNTQDNLIKSYFSETGIEYNMGRVPIGGCDFSTHPYAYNMYPEGDGQLTNFTLSKEDFDYKIPLIKKAQQVAKDEILLAGAAWSPPPWMKSNNDWGGKSELRPEYYQTWADYHIKFLEEYKNNGVKFWSVSTGNEPSIGVVPLLQYNSLGWEPSKQGQWLAENLAPSIKNSSIPDVKILALDDQRFSLPWWINQMAEGRPKVLEYINGISVHWYANTFIDPDVLDATHEKYPEKFLIGTEACNGFFLESEDVALGSWERAESYMINILEDLNHWFVGWIDWNLALDRQGGPNWYENYVDSAIIVLPEADEFVKQPVFYVMGHFSKFIPRGSVRVHVDIVSGSMSNVAFLRPDGGIAVVFYNPFGFDKTLMVREEDKGSLIITVKSRTIHTLVYW